MEHIAWMAWTLPTAIFFVMLASTLGVMTWLAVAHPEAERIGVLRIPTTRGDRLFISLLGSAFIFLAWLGIMGTPLWGGLVIALIYAFAVFRWV